MSEPDPSILRYYVGIVWRWKWLVIAPLVILPAVAYALAVSQAPVWGSSAAVLLNHQDQIASTLAGVETPPDDAGRYAVTQGLVARSPVLLDRVVNAAGVPQMSARTLVQHSDVQPNADVLQFYVTNRDPDAATRLVNAYARGYTSYRRELDTRNLDSTVQA